MFRRSQFDLLLSGALCLGVVSPRAYAQGQVPREVDAAETETSTERRERARQHFDRGLAIAQSRRKWDAALAEFLASRELYPTRSATRNAAVALRQLGRAAEALDYYLLLLEEFSATIPEGELASLRSEMSALQQSVGQLEVHANTPGTRVVINGRQRGTTPLAPLNVDAGSHTLRLSKDGFETIEITVSVAGGQSRVVKPTLQPLRASGTLVVREAGGANLDVVLDSAVVGKTPWAGAIAPGAHSVFLRGAHGLGTAPSSAEVKRDQTTSLTLRAVRLEASISVAPIPSNATVFVDGVSVGNGIWEGHLPTGTHRLEVVAPGHLPFRRDVAVNAGRHEVLRAQLDRDLSSPLWRDAMRPHPYAELMLGAALSASFRGGADQFCNCSERERPFGFLLAGRIGYAVVGGLGVELTGGYLNMSESMTRTVRTERERVWIAGDYRDETTLDGPLAAVTVSYRLLERTPITARAGFGLAALRARTSNSGTFRGVLTSPQTSGESQSYASRVNIEEVERSLLTPFASTEIRFGYRMSKRFSVDLGLGLLLLLPPREPRAGANNLSGPGERSTLLDAPGTTWSNGREIIAGQLVLPEESVAGPFLALSPSLGLRAEF